MFNYIKQKQRKNCKIGPFIKDNVIIDREPAEILKDQYESVFSTPKHEFYINDHIKFFKNCVFCEKEIVHFCKEDNENYTKTSPLFGLSSILISENVFLTFFVGQLPKKSILT